MMTTPLLEGTDGVEKMSQEPRQLHRGDGAGAEAMFAKVISISDELMWRYYPCSASSRPPEIEAGAGEGAAHGLQARARGTAGRGLPWARRGAERRRREWRRVHQETQAPTEMPVVSMAAGCAQAPGRCWPRRLAASKSEAERLLRQRAVKVDGGVVEPGPSLELGAGDAFVLSVGSSRFVRFIVE